MSLKNFLFFSKIGQGAYSTVHKVKRISDQKIYALKQIKLSNLKQKQKQNALNQVRLLASINCDYIIKYKQSFFDQNSNTLCIVIEYAQGGDLQKLIFDKKSKLHWIEQKQIWKIFRNLTMGLNNLHQNNIIHRDMKSANIFIVNGQYKIADLNVSKLLKNTLAYTQTGTPYYASPQVWQDKPYQLKSDIWSLGCIIYEACALKPPFTATNMQGLYKKVMKGVYPKLPTVYSEKLQSIIAKCLQLNPNRRSSTKQLLNLLNNQFKQTSQPKNSEINMLNTIKIPRNIKNLKNQLPKSNYQAEKYQSNLNHLEAKFSQINQQKLRQIVKAKQLQSRFNQRKQNQKNYMNPEIQQNQKKIKFKTQIYQNKQKNLSDIYIQKNKSHVNILPRIRLQSQIDISIKKKPRNVQQLMDKMKQLDQKKYQHNRPAWWG